MRNTVFLLLGMLLLITSSAVQAEESTVPEFKYKALWSGMSSSPTGRFAGIGKELKDMGVEVTRVSNAVVLTEELLKDYDFLVFACRQEILSLGEQDLIVRYVQKGGSLLAVCGLTGGHPEVINPVVNNFGIMVTRTRTGSTKMTYFAHPATTNRRPIESCLLTDSLLMTVSNGAEIIGGRDFAGAPASMECYLGLGGKTACGRVIVTSDDGFWQTYG